MLVLTRRLNESIIIGDDIRVVVADLQPGKVRLGIDAPKAVPVHREEVYEAIQAQNRARANPGAANAAIPEPHEA